jgi:hypothetical protein
MHDGIDGRRLCARKRFSPWPYVSMVTVVVGCTIAASAVAASRTAKITGQVTGHRVRLVTTYNSFSPGYVATFVGKIGTFNLRMSGTWTSNRGQSGRWTALRAKNPKKKK